VTEPQTTHQTRRESKKKNKRQGKRKKKSKTETKKTRFALSVKRRKKPAERGLFSNELCPTQRKTRPWNPFRDRPKRAEMDGQRQPPLLRGGETTLVKNPNFLFLCGGFFFFVLVVCWLAKNEASEKDRFHPWSWGMKFNQ